MYFPFFRARQYELLALRDTMCKHIDKKYVKPIIEPVVEGTRDIYKFCEEFDKVGAGFIFVVNPSKGYFVKNRKKILNLIENCIQKNELIEFAMRVNDGTPLSEIEGFINSFSNFPVSLIHESSIKEVTELQSIIDVSNYHYNIFLKEHTGRAYRDKFSNWQNVLLEDCFNRVEPNSAYGGEEFFSDAVFCYAQDGYTGFGDYSVVGDHYAEGGGQARACAIHITYEEDQEIWVRHFLSQPREDVDDGATLASEAIEELVEYIQEHWSPNDYTFAIKEFIGLHEDGKRTNLAFVKKLAMRHHLELTNNLLID
ncbi:MULTISPECIES: sce7725 family protein [Vibrio]|uniref:sce7725 family protein n=1 Tax=Vibrio TaxID=662 RepID=UPI00063500E2|nr:MULTISPECIES: sce7725 family protein [Vibrio]PTP74982.1 hypothetical protein CWO06_13100 [Vibrio splendidus]UPR29788.1 sce7725 family protein [Vibrio crassostreae]CDT39553.1 conserved hypothetical protein [Vibrio coralliirubri]